MRVGATHRYLLAEKGNLKFPVRPFRCADVVLLGDFGFRFHTKALIMKMSKRCATRFGSPVALTTRPLRDAEIPQSEKKETRAIASVSLPVVNVLAAISFVFNAYTIYIAKPVPKISSSVKKIRHTFLIYPKTFGKYASPIGNCGTAFAI